MATAMTDHIQNNSFGRSTDGHRDDWSARWCPGVRCPDAELLSVLPGDAERTVDEALRGFQ